VVAVDLPNARRLAFSVVAGQAVVTLIFAAGSFLIAGSIAAVSALIGGGIGTLASLVMALIAFGRGTDMNAQRVMRAFYVGEAAKLGLVIVLFVVVLKSMKVSPGALFGAYVATFFVYWVALANALPPLGGRPPGGPKSS
jgi:ATP synthase protein I